MGAMLIGFALNSAITTCNIAALNREGSRILLVSAPSASDLSLDEQRRDIDAWKGGAANRDLIMVEVRGKESVRRYDDQRYATTGNDVTKVRQQYRLTASKFSLVLIGKDGHVALRSTKPLTGAKLQATIDAMPMRRAGER